MTAEELLATTIPNKRTELVRGRLVVHDLSGAHHGSVTANLAAQIGNHLRLTGVGQAVIGTGFILFRAPDTVRAADIAIVRRERWPSPSSDTYPELAPDLVVEVLSPSDRPGETLAKVGDWLEAGARLAWVIDPQRRLARIYRADGTESLLAESDALNGEDVLPGFHCPLGAIL
jgi:Uma2 family endonuclease